VVDPQDLEPAFAHVSDDLRTQYLLGYYAPKRGTDNSFRAIKIKMKDAELPVSAAVSEGLLCGCSVGWV